VDTLLRKAGTPLADDDGSGDMVASVGSVGPRASRGTGANRSQARSEAVRGRGTDVVRPLLKVQWRADNKN
jgi:hypothetical protein